MAHEPPLVHTAEINALCMEIAELVGALGSTSALSTSPVLHRELRITTIHSSLMIEGNTLSREAVTAILDGERVLGPARQILEVDKPAAPTGSWTIWTPSPPTTCCAPTAS